MSDSIKKYQPYLEKGRVRTSIYPELVVCDLCDGILWLPKACKHCETSFCLSCIKSRKIESTEPFMCPHKDCRDEHKNRREFIERPCPHAVRFILNKLEVTCRNTSHGCNEILPYDNLETHEEVCGYQQITCDGCKEKIAKMDFKEHHSACSLVQLQCPECNTVYKRKNQTDHTETKCLGEKLLQQQKRLDKFEELVNRLTEKVAQLTTQNPIIREVT